MDYSRITLFAGHYGSGKTNLAVNYALYLRKYQSKVVVADLDIVNPYFRTKDGANMLNAADIKLISSDFANSNLDAPSMPSAAMSLFDDKSLYGVIDVGGDDRGAYAVGKYANRLMAEKEANLLFVMNCYRPLTAGVSDTIQVLREIEAALHFKLNGLVNNSNLGNETKADDILASKEYAEEVSRKTGLPIVFTSVQAHLMSELENKITDLFPVQIMYKEKWRI